MSENDSRASLRIKNTKKDVSLMKLDMVGIITSNMSEALKFYNEFGFAPMGDVTGDYVELEHQGIRISLNTSRMLAGIYGYEPKTTGDKLELAFLCDSVEEVDFICQKMKDAGYSIYKEPWDAFWGQRYGIIQDVDGNLLSVFANLAK